MRTLSPNLPTGQVRDAMDPLLAYLDSNFELFSEYLYEVNRWGEQMEFSFDKRMFANVKQV